MCINMGSHVLRMQTSTPGLWWGEMEALRRERGYLFANDRGDSVSVACDTQRSLCGSQATVWGTRASGQNSLCVSCILLQSDWQQGFFVCVYVCVCGTFLFLRLSTWQMDRNAAQREWEERGDSCHFHRQQWHFFSMFIYLVFLSSSPPSLSCTYTHPFSHTSIHPSF